jgi:V8-like Glu-specific endopeptidase
MSICVSLHNEAQIWKSRLFSNDSSLTIPTILLPLVNNDSLIHYYDNISKKQPYILAKGFTLNIKTNNNGLWKKNTDNSYSWMCRMRSKTAYSLSFTFKQIDLPKGSSLYIVNTNNITYGPFTTKNCNEDSTLYTEQIPGDEVVLELDIPANNDTTKQFFTITNICHDFRDFYHENTSNRGVGGSGSCEHDINCGIGLNWQKEKRSIVYYTYILSSGEYVGQLSRCTGTLINNTAFNELPYILTSYHCVKDQQEATSSIFYFNYENSICKASDAQLTQVLSGAKLVAKTKDTTEVLDFTLLRIKSIPPRSFGSYYSGWTLNKTKQNNVVALHHPRGDALKISYSNGFINDSSYTGDPGFLSQSHWQIAQWDTGVTEPGSSGCPLFNSNHQIIGNLTGGDSDCKDTYNIHNDYFAKFYKSWDYFSDSSNQLKYWLDPIELGIKDCPGYDPQLGNDNPISNVIYNEELVTYNFGNSVKGGWTGYNDPRLLFCADRFTGIKNQYIYAIKFPIQLFNTSVDVSKIKLIIWSGIEKPESIVYSDYLKKDSILSNIYYCTRFANRINVGSNFFIGFDLSSLSNNDSLFFYSVKNRTNGSNSLYYYYKNNWVQATNLGLNSSLGFELYVTDNISPERKTTKLPEKLIAIDSDSLISLSTKELFHLDSVVNYDENNVLQLHYLTDNKGLWTGSNQNGIVQFDEKYRFETTTNNYISGIKLAVAKNTIKNQNTKINLSILSGTQFPDTVIYSTDINAYELKPNYYNVIKFNSFLKTDSNLHIVLNVVNLDVKDTFAIYMGTAVDQNNFEHSLFKNSIGWLNYYMYDIHESLGLSLETEYGPYVYDSLAHNYSYKIENQIKPSDVIFKSFFLYPNPCWSSLKTVKLNLGNYFSKNVKITIYDIFGRIISVPTPTINTENIIVISTSNLVSGLYYVRIEIDNQLFRPLTLIIQ